MQHHNTIKFLLIGAALGAALFVTATDRVSARQSDGLAEGAGVEILRGQCLNCHQSDLIVAQRLSNAGWGRELDKMTRWGAKLKDTDREPLLEYLTRHYGPRPLRTATVPTAPAVNNDSVSRGQAIYEAKCLLCHESDLIVAQRLARPGWVREVEKMTRWGAKITDAEKDPLVDYLFRSYGPRPKALNK
ncbi:MAG: hypothetical protein ACKV2V_27955 [Blastocatellia bacterium]